MFKNSELFKAQLMDDYDSIEDLFDFVRSDDYLEEVCELLDLGVDPNYQTTYGITPLHEAALSKENNIKVVQELIKRGSEIDLNDHLSYTALHHAVVNRKKSVVKELLQAGASVNAKNYLGETPLHLAVSKISDNSSNSLRADILIISYLLEHEDIDCNLKDFWGYTPLLVAIEEGQEAAAILLLNKNADPNICNNTSESPLHVAFHLPPNLIEFNLMYHGVSIYSLDEMGQTPLDILIKNGLGSPANERVELILRFIAFKYSITSDFKRKLEIIPHLSQFLNECCDEVDHMRRDFICGNITMNDFLYDCFEEKDIDLLQQIHKPVVDRLIRNIYRLYLMEILFTIPKFNLLTILQMIACSKKLTKDSGEKLDLTDLLSILDVIYFFSNYLSSVHIFCLIVAFSDTEVSESVQNLHFPDNFIIFHLKSQNIPVA